MDALAGFAGNSARVERQVFRANRPRRITRNVSGQPTIVYDSFEDPRQPDVIHHRIVRLEEFVENNSPSGQHENQLSLSICVVIFAFWDEEIRPRLARASQRAPNDIKSNAFGDLRIIRHAALHNGSILTRAQHQKMTVFGDLFTPNVRISIDNDKMHMLFAFLKKAAAELFFEYLGEETPEGVKEIVLQLK